MTVSVLEEPDLEFGGGTPHIDVRYGLMLGGPADHGQASAPTQIRLAIVGTSESVSQLTQWFDACKETIPGASDSLINLRPPFPGFCMDHTMRSEIVVIPSAEAIISKTEVKSVLAGATCDGVTEKAVDLFADKVSIVAESLQNVHVIVCAVPHDVLTAMFVRGENDTTNRTVDFHDKLKAISFRHGKPIQVITPSTYDSTKKKVTRDGNALPVQDTATRAWNLHVALYYKAGGTPWRLRRNPLDLDTCYVGVGFYEALDGKSLDTSIAQVFNEKGEGMIVRGAQAHMSSEDRQPHLRGSDSRKLLLDALDRYKVSHKNLPARVVLHKTSQFDFDEIKGFGQAIEEREISLCDMVSVRNSRVRLHRASASYPVLRGTQLLLDDDRIVLYTRGSVPFYSTYTGLYMPSPIELRIARSDESPDRIASEVLALTKLNWNHTQFDASMPITVHAARKVGAILRYCQPDQSPAPMYRFYM